MADNECKLHEGEVVLIMDEVLPRLKWRKGKTERLIPGNDKLIRGAVVRVFQSNTGKSSLLKRPVQLLVPLEIYSKLTVNYPNNPRRQIFTRSLKPS